MITVFTPTYNRGYTLSRLYNSLLSQTYMDFEWLIIDDGSMKGLTAEKLYSFADTASMLLFKTAGVLCDNNKSNMQKFIQDIDEADREIY